jgi:tetratricopeptide (TPR) repeat protein
LLTDAHLLRETTADSYQFHDLLRTYAVERAAADDPPAARTAALQRVLNWYRQTADAAATMLVSTHSHVPPDETSPEPLTFGGYDHALPWCDAEYAHLMAAVDFAVERGEDAIIWKLAVALASYLQIRRPSADWFAAGQTAARAGRRRRPARAGRRAGDLSCESWLLNRLCHRYALDCLHHALPIRTESGEWREEGGTPNNSGAAHGDQGRFEDSIRYFHGALGLATEIGDQPSKSTAPLNLGEARQGLAQHDKIVFHLQQALRIAREGDDAGVEGVRAEQPQQGLPRAGVAEGNTWANEG